MPEDDKNYKFGNDTGTPQGVAGSSVGDQYFLYMYNNYIERSFIKALRVAFAHPATPEKFRYSEDLNLSQVDIRSDYPQRIQKVPIIVVNVGTGKADMTYVGDELLRQTTTTKDGIEGYLYGGIMTLGVSFQILAGSKRDIENLSDIVTVYLRFLFRKTFFDQNMAYTEVSNEGIASEETPDGSAIKSVFTNTISTNVTSEFNGFIAKDLYETIKSLIFTIGTYF